MPRHKLIYHTCIKLTKSSSFSRFTVIVSYFLATTISVTVLSPSQAQTPTQTQPQTQIQTQTTGIRYNPPNRGAPGSVSTSDAGSRSCGLMVFGPAQSHWGETLQAYPSFWLYASNPGTVAAELAVEETAEVVHQGTFEITQGQAITSYTLPETAAVLNINSAYRWNFTLDCPGDPDPSANGVIVRREATPQETEPQEAVLEATDLEEVFLEETSELIEPIDPLIKARQLAAEGFWFDTIDILNRLRLVEASEDSPSSPSTDSQTDSQISPSAATQDWHALLEQGGWREILGDRFEQITTTDFSTEPSPQREPASEREPAPEVNP